MGVNCSGDTGGRRVGVVDARPRLFPAAPCGGITKREKRNTYVQIVRFEGAQENWDERIEEVGNRIRGGGEGSPMAEVRGAVKRAMTLVDRENGRGAGVIFCESEEDLRRVEEAMPACRRGDAGVCRDVRGRGRRVALVAWGQHSPRVPLSRRGYSIRRKCPLRVAEALGQSAPMRDERAPGLASARCSEWTRRERIARIPMALAFGATQQRSPAEVPDGRLGRHRKVRPRPVVPAFRFRQLVWRRRSP